MIQAAAGRTCSVYVRCQHGKVTFNKLLRAKDFGQVRSFASTSQRRQKEELLVRLIGHYNKARLILGKQRVDVVPEGFSLIYRSPLERYIVYSQLGCALFTVGIAGAFGFTLATDVPAPSESALFEDTYEVATGLVFFAVLVALVQVIQLRSPLRMYYSEKEKKFLSVFGAWLPLATRRLIIEPGQVKATGYQSSVVPWAAALHTFSGSNARVKKLILFNYSFRYPVYYNRLLGVQK